MNQAVKPSMWASASVPALNAALFCLYRTQGRVWVKIRHAVAPTTLDYCSLMARRLTQAPRPPRPAPHPVEPDKSAATKLKPIRLRPLERHTIRLAPAALR